MLSFLKKMLFKYRLKRVRKYIVIGNSHFFGGFNLTLFKPKPNKIFLTIGNDTILDCKIVFETDNGSVSIGNNSYIGNSTIICKDKVIFEDNIFVAWGCYFYDHNSHSINYLDREQDILQQLEDFRAGKLFIENKNWDVVNHKPIKICSNAWIGMNCLILKGVTVGEGAIVGAGSVVTKDVAPWTIVGGNPAVVIKEIPLKLRKK